MKSPYLGTSTMYNEKAIALQDYKLGGFVKLYIPSLMPTLNKNEFIDNNRKTPTNKIMNKNKDILGLTSYTTCNYVEVKVPTDISFVKEGKKGDTFLISFIGGNINNISIIRRLD